MGRAVSLVGALFALLCVALVFFALPAGAQDDGGEIPPGTPANGIDTDGNDSPDVIVVEVSGCTVVAGASITLEDDDEARVIFTDGDREITIVSQEGRLRIEGPLGDFDPDGEYLVVSSTGITCGEVDAGSAEDQYGTGDVDDRDDVVVDTIVKGKIPNTGGPPLLALGAALLCAALVVGRGVLRP